MDRLRKLLSTGSRPAVSDVEMLAALVEQYPWFIAPKLMLMSVYMREGNTAGYAKLRGALALRPSLYPVPDVLLDGPDMESLRRPETLNIIDEFLAKDGLKIVPAEAAPNEGIDISLASAKESDEDFVTEKLAEIYLAQGLADKAKAIYSKLSLKFPEKSVYFAEIIGKIDNETSSINDKK